ncbi:ATP-binding protein [Marinobacter sp. SS21]|uniref:ATP-binding protein n=1 Tax=Marinobacter sp. SS21 TaxID=2979460 RepID=UPI00232A96F0|nr:ATP-binding protein [Marinobacter sp. SS21]MDC0663421.1 ATP-binding protein [Marinobacter sp. SS21]
MTLLSKISSVRKALLLLLLPTGVGLMALAWFVHGLLLDRMSRDFVENRIQDEVAFLEHQIRQFDGRIEELQTGDYFEEVFHHAFVIHTPQQTILSPESWAPVLEPLVQSGPQGAIRIQDYDAQANPVDILAYRKAFLVAGQPIVVIVSEDMAALKASQVELHIWTAIVSIALILLLAAVIWLGITLAMKPVASLRTALRSLQGGEISRLDVHAPEEFQPLVLQLNQLLDSLDQRLARSREALANLSHSIKTPISAVRQILEDTSRPLDMELRQEMAARLGEIARQLEAEMRRSKFAGPQIGKSAYPVKQARDLLWMMGRLYPGKSFELMTELTDDCRWPVEEHDLNEILGNLLDNAGKWSTRCVELCLQAGETTLSIQVSDDGPGVDDKLINDLGTRGLRLDEQTPGHGLGLAIVADIVQRYGATLSFSNRPSKGLEAILKIPTPELPANTAHAGRR